MNSPKVFFENRLFYYSLVCIISALLVYNLYSTITAVSIYTLIAIVLQIVLLVLILTKNQYAKIAIIVWAVIAFFIGNGFGLIADILDGFNSGFRSANLNSYLYNTIGLAIGIAIVSFTRNMVKIVSTANTNDITE